MTRPPPKQEVILKTKRRAECLEFHLVLEATGIAAEIVASDEGWLLVVSDESFSAAAEELEAYQRERQAQAAVSPSEVPQYGGAGLAVAFYVCVNVIIAFWVAQSAYGLNWLPAGDMQAGEVMAGAWWRTVTALTLHADVGHLSANLIFGTLFGFLAGKALGGGLAWLTILLSGAGGNWINAFFRPPEHLSIGASTAVFAALGVLVAHTLRTEGSSPEGPFKRWSPLIGGVLLLAFLGVGNEDTDVLAHVGGFLVGVPAGWLACSLPRAWMSNKTFQQIAGMSALAIVACAWVTAFIAQA